MNPYLWSATDTIDLSEHEFRSVRRWLHDLEGFGDLPIYLERPQYLERPSLGLCETTRTSEDRGRSMLLSKASWMVEVFGEDFWETKRLMAAVRSHLLQVALIPLWLFDWRYPAVLAGADPAGAGSDWVVGVSAVDVEGRESLCGLVDVEVPDGAAVGVAWPTWPYFGSVASSWRVYTGQTEGELALVDEVENDQRREWRFATPSLGDGDGSPQTEGSVIGANAFMRVLCGPGQAPSGQMTEDAARNGIWNGAVTFHTSVDLSRLRAPGLGYDLVPRPIGEIWHRIWSGPQDGPVPEDGELAEPRPGPGVHDVRGV